MKFGKLRLWARGVAAAVLLALPAVPAWAYNTAYTQYYPLADGVTYYDVAAENATGIQRAHYIEYTPNEAVQPVVGYGKGFYGRSTIGYVADYLKNDLGMQVLAGFNADFFNTNTGVPIGMVIDDGRLLSSPGGAYAVGFREDGSYIFGKPKLNMVISDGTKSVVVENFNKTRSSYTVNLYDKNWGTETRLSGVGTNVLLEKIDADDEVTIGGRIKMRVVSVREESTSTPIAENQMVLTVAATGDATKVGIFYAGQEVELSISADDPAWNEAVYAVGGKSLILDGKLSAGDSPTGNAARTAIGFREDGTMVFFENDGRLKDFSVGLSPAALGEEMLAFGVQNAINLDGGGSSVMAVRRFGFPLAVVNSPSDGKARMVANHIFLVNRQEAGNTPQVMQVQSAARYVLAGSTAEVTAYALNEALEQVNFSEELEWSVPSYMGEIVEPTEGEEINPNKAYIKVGDTTGEMEVSVHSGSLSGGQKLYVLSSVSGLAIQRDGQTLSTLNVLSGDKVSLDVSGVYKGQSVIVDNGGIKWSVSGDIGTIDEDGCFRAGGRDSSGVIIAEAGTTRAQLPVVLQNAGAGASIVAVNLPTKLAEGELGEFSWRVTNADGTNPDESQIMLLLDGAATGFDYAWGTGIVGCSLVDLTAGTHRLTLIVDDGAGVLSRKSITVTVGDAAAIGSYTDVSAEHWAADFIGYLEARGLMQGETNAAGELTFNPARNLTRAEFAVIAARYLNLDCSQAITLPYVDRPDVPAWAIGAVRAVYTAGIMQGESVGDEVYFYPRNNISRQEAMAVISRILGDGYTPEEQEFADGEQISAWAREHIEKLVTLGFVGGYEDGTIKPLNSITRAEIAKVLYNLY